MKTYTHEELAKIIEKHQAWLDDQENGERANLSGANSSLRRRPCRMQRT